MQPTEISRQTKKPRLIKKPQLTKVPDPKYLPVASLDLANRRLQLALNLLGFVVLLFSAALLFLLARELQPEILPPSSFLLLGGPELLALVVGIVGVILLHEVIHGLFFWIFTGERFQLGIRPFYAFAASPNWAIPRGKFVVIGLAPLLIITSLGIPLLAVLPLSAAAVVLASLAVNAAGSTGDLVIISWLFAKPSGQLVRDRGNVMTKYRMATEEVAAMAKKWMALLAYYDVDEETALSLFSKIVSAYDGPGRYYHNFNHVEIVLNTIAELKPLSKDYHVLLLAAWFHDVVYVAENKDNEELSARYAFDALINLGLGEETARRVSDLIMVTADHTAPDDDIDAKILIDADLAPIAFEEERFNQQSEAIRMESAHMPVEEFNESRRHFLTGMLDRDQIYLTDQVHEELEEKARENIKKSLAALH